MFFKLPERLRTLREFYFYITIFTKQKPTLRQSKSAAWVTEIAL